MTWLFQNNAECGLSYSRLHPPPPPTSHRVNQEYLYVQTSPQPPRTFSFWPLCGDFQHRGEMRAHIILGLRQTPDYWHLFHRGHPTATGCQQLLLMTKMSGGEKCQRSIHNLSGPSGTPLPMANSTQRSNTASITSGPL